MALTKDRKNQVIGEVTELLTNSKMTVVASYKGLGVKSLQALRRSGRENGTTIKVVKNRLVIKAIQSTDKLKDVDVSALEGMLLYAFNGQGEVASAQTLNVFAKANPVLEFVGAFTNDGRFIGAEEVTTLANLPSKDQLIAQVISQLLSTINNTINGLSGNIHAILDGVALKAGQ